MRRPRRARSPLPVERGRRAALGARAASPSAREGNVQLLTHDAPTESDDHPSGPTELTDCYLLGAGVGIIRSRPSSRCSRTRRAASSRWRRDWRAHRTRVSSENQGDEGSRANVAASSPRRDPPRGPPSSGWLPRTPLDQLEALEWVKATAARHRDLPQAVHAGRRRAPTLPAGPSFSRTSEPDGGELGSSARQHASEARADRGSTRSASRPDKTLTQEWQAVIRTGRRSWLRTGSPAERSGKSATRSSAVDRRASRSGRTLPDGFRRVLREIDRLPGEAAIAGQRSRFRTRRRRKRPRPAGFCVAEASSSSGEHAAREAQESLRRALRLSRVDLDRDQGAPVDRFLRADDRRSGRRRGVAGHPLVEPRVRRRAGNSATATASRWCGFPADIARDQVAAQSRCAVQWEARRGWSRDS